MTYCQRFLGYTASKKASRPVRKLLQPDPSRVESKCSIYYGTANTRHAKGVVPWNRSSCLARWRAQEMRFMRCGGANLGVGMQKIITWFSGPRGSKVVTVNRERSTYQSSSPYHQSSTLSCKASNRLWRRVGMCGRTAHALLQVPLSSRASESAPSPRRERSIVARRRSRQVTTIHLERKASARWYFGAVYKPPVRCGAIRFAMIAIAMLDYTCRESQVFACQRGKCFTGTHAPCV